MERILHRTFRQFSLEYTLYLLQSDWLIKCSMKIRKLLGLYLYFFSPSSRVTKVEQEDPLLIRNSAQKEDRLLFIQNLMHTTGTSLIKFELSHFEDSFMVKPLSVLDDSLKCPVSPNLLSVRNPVFYPLVFANRLTHPSLLAMYAL